MSIQLEMKRTFKASQEKVFQAFTEAEILKQWFCPGEMTVPHAEMDKKVGGSYTIEMREPEGKIHKVSGKIKEFSPVDKISYTWKWATPEANETLVTFSFKSLGDETEVHLLHENFVETEHRDHHAQGWEGCLNNFEKFCNR